MKKASNYPNNFSYCIKFVKIEHIIMPILPRHYLELYNNVCSINFTIE